MSPIISVQGLTKTYGSSFHALRNVNLQIDRGEIFALLGPNGAGKTTLIGVICGIVNPSAGRIAVGDYDIIRDYRAARSMIGLVPQELATDSFETVWATVTFSRGLFGKKKDPTYIEKVLRDLSLWDKKDSQIMTLSGGMKRRVMIAKALAHEPSVLFLDEPTAGVDVELRKDMWEMVRALRSAGATIVLTTHYIEEAEEMADRIGIINKQMTLHLQKKLDGIPLALSAHHLTLADHGRELIYTYDTQSERSGITALLDDLTAAGIGFNDLHTTQSSLEDIFVDLVRQQP
jgi:ABC-2 type transport system ATP-binding protein